MGRLVDFFRKKRDQAPLDAPPPAPPPHLAFVLLTEATLPSASAIIDAYARFEPGGSLEVVPEEEAEPATRHEIISLTSNVGDGAFVALFPAPVPNGEADQAAQFSVGSMGTGWTLPLHSAHLVVTSTGSTDPPLLQSLSRFTSLVAAVAQASSSIGVYWGNAGATHGTEFFVSLASEQGVTPRIMLWTGVSVARPPAKISLLSLGMGQLNLPNLLLVAPRSSGNATLETFFDLLSYLANRGSAIPDGDTVGRTAEERLKVRYVSSPIDASTKVWRVELP
jgi:hypothetical protein